MEIDTETAFIVFSFTREFVDGDLYPYLRVTIFLTT